MKHSDVIALVYAFLFGWAFASFATGAALTLNAIIVLAIIAIVLVILIPAQKTTLPYSALGAALGVIFIVALPELSLAKLDIVKLLLGFIVIWLIPKM